MRKYKATQLVIMVTVLILELLPYGVVCNFAVDPKIGGVYRVTYSYFSLIPFGYANFGPLLTAVLTCIITVLLILSFTLIKKEISNAITALSCVAVFISMLPLILFGLSSYSVISLVITCLLVIKTALGVYLCKCKK